jgi:hypothetical protein
MWKRVRCNEFPFRVDTTTCTTTSKSRPHAWEERFQQLGAYKEKHKATNGKRKNGTLVVCGYGHATSKLPATHAREKSRK